MQKLGSLGVRDSPRTCLFCSGKSLGMGGTGRSGLVFWTSGRGSGGAGGAQAPPTVVISMKPPLNLSYKFEKDEEGGEGLEEEEGEAAPPAVIPGSATDEWNLRT